ncbi:filaggrin-2-like [Dermacentor silvarum]|uniref:filaggrin-2-like n=1 Tax=Dermacentor silvarum TaxID=543639 RepID=UPI0021009170|nr:filaggrin-2-like [Dermacentor silvarum]
MTYDCSFFGNKFPTSQECELTCGTMKGTLLPILPAGQQNLVSQTTSQAQMSLGGGITVPQLQTAVGQQPGSPIPTGTEVLGLPGNVNPSLGNQTTPQSTLTTGPGIAMTPIGNGDQQLGGPGARSTHAVGPSGNVNQPVGAGQATSAPSMVSTGVAVGQAGEQQLGRPAASSIPALGPTASLNGTVGAGQATSPQTMAGIGIAVEQTANGKQELGTSAVSGKLGSSQQGSLGTPGGQHKPAQQLNLPTLKVYKRPTPPPIDEECNVTAPLATKNECQRRRWYYNKGTGACLPSCSKIAPFSNKIACDGVCRTPEACDFPMASIPCFFGRVHQVFIYNQFTKKCFKGYDCGFFGNKFPTLQECQDTCRKHEVKRKLKGTVTTQGQNTGSGVSSGPGLLGAETGTGRPVDSLLSGLSNVLRLVGHLTVRGAEQLSNSIGSSSQASGQAGNANSSASRQHDLSVSGTSTSSGLAGQQLGTEGSTGSVIGSTQPSGSTNILGAQQQGSIGGGLIAHQSTNAHQSTSSSTSSTHSSGRTHNVVVVHHGHTGAGTSAMQPQSAQGSSISPSRSSEAPGNTITFGTPQLGGTGSSLLAHQSTSKESTSSSTNRTDSSGHKQNIMVVQHGQPGSAIVGMQNEAGTGSTISTLGSTEASSLTNSLLVNHGHAGAGILAGQSATGEGSTGSAIGSTQASGNRNILGTPQQGSIAGGLIAHQSTNAHESTSSSTSSTHSSGMTHNLVVGQHGQTGAGISAMQPQTSGSTNNLLTSATGGISLPSGQVSGSGSSTGEQAGSWNSRGDTGAGLSATGHAMAQGSAGSTIGSTQSGTTNILGTQHQGALNGGLVAHQSIHGHESTSSTTSSTHSSGSAHSLLVEQQGHAGSGISAVRPETTVRGSGISLPGSSEALGNTGIIGAQQQGSFGSGLLAHQSTSQESTSSSANRTESSGHKQNIMVVEHGNPGSAVVGVQNEAANRSTSSTTTSTEASGLTNSLVVKHGQAGAGLLAGKSVADEKCKVTPPLAKTDQCKHRWYYNEETGACLPSCSTVAPFSNKIACDGVCRSLEACTFPMIGTPCLFRKLHKVYIYDRYKKRCFKANDCDFFGNKFPSLQECQNTCAKYEAQQKRKATLKGISQASTNSQNTGAGMAHQPPPSQSGIPTGPGFVGVETGTGGAHLSNDLDSSSQASGQRGNTDSSVRRHHSLSLSGMSTSSGFAGQPLGTGSAHNKLTSGTGGISQAAGLIIGSGASAPEQAASSHSGGGTSTGLSTTAQGMGMTQNHGTSGTSNLQFHHAGQTSRSDSNRGNQRTSLNTGVAISPEIVITGFGTGMAQPVPVLGDQNSLGNFNQTPNITPLPSGQTSSGDQASQNDVKTANH